MPKSNLLSPSNSGKKPDPISPLRTANIKNQRNDKTIPARLPAAPWKKEEANIAISIPISITINQPLRPPANDAKLPQRNPINTNKVPRILSMVTGLAPACVCRTAFNILDANNAKTVIPINHIKPPIQSTKLDILDNAPPIAPTCKVRNANAIEIKIIPT